ncbi:helix-turn-helix domain-containing protein [Actinoplanes sp. NPDC051861]|uniref:helix-turn-helix domain-containing protein n=1 Tax=Actinoplanes sp. NPDC051861 TaxID=3155170 RepID=UPI0034329327
MAFVLDTAGIPVHERVEAVHTAMMYASAPCHVVHENPGGPVYARMEVWDLGDANVFTQRSSGIRLVRTAKLARQDAMPVIALSVQQRGTGRLEQGDRRELTPPGELLGVDLSGSYDYCWSGDGAAGCVQIPLDRLGLPVDVIRPALGNLHASPLYRLVTSHIGQLARDPARITTDPAAATVAAATIDLCRALLASVGRAGPHTRQALADTLLTRVRAYVRNHLTDPGLSPATIAAAHNISLRHLYKLCAQADLSLEQWIISERLRGARHELLRTAARPRPIAAIARSWGFRDPTHFTRRFQARYGTTPGQFRRTSAEARESDTMH